MVFTGRNGADFGLFGKPDRGIRGYEQRADGEREADDREQKTAWTDAGGR